jgi:hypothetical protein
MPWHGDCFSRARTALGRFVTTEATVMLWAIIAILLILWLLGFTLLNVGGLIHLLLVVALIVLIYQLVTGRRAV